jgi:hypothetical protein
MKQIVSLSQLTKVKSDHLANSEQTIERAARNAFEEWGVQLKYIRDNRLYIAFSPGCTWERYCKERWEMSREKADKLIQAYDITVQLTQDAPEDGTICTVMPAKESHIRPLTKLKKPSERATVWQRVVDNTNGKAITACQLYRSAIIYFGSKVR